MKTLGARIAAALSLAVLSLAALPAFGQGRTDYLNVESPQVHPIEVATVDGHDFLLIANTPDSSIEIWSTNAAKALGQRFLKRVRVGLEPVSVRFHVGRSQLYTANFLGDSISIVELSATGPETITARLVTTTLVGDEPTDLAFYDKNPSGAAQETLFVTHMMLDGVSWLDAVTLDAFPGFSVFPATAQKGDLDADGIADQVALKQPRTLAVVGDQILVLGHRGNQESGFYDFDLLVVDLLTLTTSAEVGGLGSMSFNMALAPNGDVFVVGAEALNQDLGGEAAAADAPTGFVKSMVSMVRGALTGSPQVKRRDVNIENQPQQLPLGSARAKKIPSLVPVAKSKALAQLTDAVVFDDGPTRKLFFTAFGSDRVGVLEPKFNQSPVSWARRKINITLAGGSAATKAGPRGLALDTNGTPRLYVLNRLENSLTEIDPVAETRLDQTLLDHDPRPAHILRGQRFLYDARLSGNGFDSCASCHPDGRSDGLAWDLGDPTSSASTPITPEELKDFAPGLGSADDWPDDKELMVTQSMQGLVNFEVPPAVEDLLSNKPHYWRGTREDFLAFDVAFESLLGRASPLSTSQMLEYEEFVHSIHYPPNPEQFLTRELTGTFGDPSSFEDGSGAQRGLKLYHMAQADGNAVDGRSCAHCHSLPEGGNNRLTEAVGTAFSPFDRTGPALSPQPTETAALRGIFQREARRDTSGSSDPALSPVSGLEGLSHSGFSSPTQGDPRNQVASLNAFNRAFFSPEPDFCNGVSEDCQKILDLNQFVRELDWGVAPIVGLPFTADDRVHTDATFLIRTNNAVNLMEGQADVANAGLAAQFFPEDGSDGRGFWYDPREAVETFREEPGGGTFSRQAIYDLVTTGSADRLIFTAVPLGSERRIAAPTKSVSALTDPLAPATITLLGMRPDTAYDDVPLMTEFWAVLIDDMDPSRGFNRVHGGLFSHTVRLYQFGLQDQGFGLDGAGAIRHDAPRRFRLAAENVLLGARLHLFIHDDAAGPEPDETAHRTAAGQPQLLEMILPLYPTNATDGEHPVWETAVELEPIVYYRMMLGGPFAPGVAETSADTDFSITEPGLLETVPPPPTAVTFNPADWNWVWVEIVNPDGKVGEGGWQRLTLE